MNTLIRIDLGMHITASILSFLLMTGTLIGQNSIPDLNREILVYILPDSLELPFGERNRVGIDRATIRSQSLARSLTDLSIIGLTRSFPDWAIDDTVRVREDGMAVRRPRLDRVFTVHLLNGVSAEEAIFKLQSLPSVLFAERHMDARLANDPNYIFQWHLNNIGQGGGTPGADIRAELAWQIFTGSANIKIGIFDTGVELSHDEFMGKISGDNISSYGVEYNWSHGTHVAGIAAASANNGEAGRGVDWNAKIVSKQIFSGTGSYLGNSVVTNKIIQAVDNNGVDVLNHSWSGPSYNQTIRMAFAYAYGMNRVSVAAMGNAGIQGATQYPAAYGLGVIAVGATDVGCIRRAQFVLTNWLSS